MRSVMSQINEYDDDDDDARKNSISSLIRRALNVVISAEFSDFLGET